MLSAYQAGIDVFAPEVNVAREIPSLFLTSITRTRGRNSWGSSRVAAKAARNVLTQEQFEQDGGADTVASWRNTVTVENVHPNTTVSFRMNNLSGSAADLKLYAYGADGKLAEVSKELWTITDETGAGVDTLADGTLYELRVSVADGGAFDLSETEKEIKISVVLAK